MDWLIEFITERPAMFARIVAAFVLAFAGVMAKYFQNRLKKEEHYFSWSKVTGEVLSFHRPCDFGYLTFK